MWVQLTNGGLINLDHVRHVRRAEKNPATVEFYGEDPHATMPLHTVKCESAEQAEQVLQAIALAIASGRALLDLADVCGAGQDPMGTVVIG